jgi:hypothetical protein
MKIYFLCCVKYVFEIRLSTQYTYWERQVAEDLYVFIKTEFDENGVLQILKILWKFGEDEQKN